MAFWMGLWSVVWFGGLSLFALLAAIIVVQGWRDLQSLLRGLRDETPGGRS
jgi:hypothetical protein